ncbi:hypothetical protein Tco_0471815 [Tanacetum coccineum]
MMLMLRIRCDIVSVVIKLDCSSFRSVSSPAFGPDNRSWSRLQGDLYGELNACKATIQAHASKISASQAAKYFCTGRLTIKRHEKSVQVQLWSLAFHETYPRWIHGVYLAAIAAFYAKYVYSVF